jgi:hypothetical protein
MGRPIRPRAGDRQWLPPDRRRHDHGGVKILLGHAPAGGYYTSSTLICARCVELLPGSTPIRVD